MGTKHLIPLGLTIVVVLSLVACKSSKVAESNKADAANAKTEIKGPKPATATAVAATTETGKIKTDETSYTKSGKDLMAATIPDLKKLGKIDVDIRKLPKNRPYIICDSKIDSIITIAATNEKYGISSTKKLYASYNNKYFVLTNQITEVSLNPNESFDDAMPSVKVEYYDAEGNIAWSKEKKNYVPDCVISNDGKYVSVLWNTGFSDQSFLEIYDSKGNLIKEFKKNIRYLIKGIVGETILLVTSPDNITDWEFTCYNIKDGNEWKVNSSSYIHVLNYSTNEQFLTIEKEGIVYSYTATGKKLWQADFGKEYAIYSISSDGKYLLRVLEKNRIELYDNINGTYIKDLGGKLGINGTFVNEFGCFVNNSKTIVLCDRISGTNTRIVFLNINGVILKDINVKGMYKSYPDFFLTEKNTIEIYFDDLMVFSTNL